MRPPPGPGRWGVSVPLRLQVLTCCDKPGRGGGQEGRRRCRCGAQPGSGGPAPQGRGAFRRPAAALCSTALPGESFALGPVAREGRDSSGRTDLGGFSAACDRPSFGFVAKALGSDGPLVLPRCWEAGGDGGGLRWAPAAPGDTARPLVTAGPPARPALGGLGGGPAAAVPPRWARRRGRGAAGRLPPAARRSRRGPTSSESSGVCGISGSERQRFSAPQPKGPFGNSEATPFCPRERGSSSGSGAKVRGRGADGPELRARAVGPRAPPLGPVLPAALRCRCRGRALAVTGRNLNWSLPR